ncbi:hypothetical protein J6A32_07490 [Methanocorpusculum sp.]|nr:hypothetical protein [Methanocorpusculum sp.]MBO5431469.1 hypothetical protein [Methanocorpusculum sp.]MBQ3570469.1 hypothetical protein [Methanocorpusculum sp.]
MTRITTLSIPKKDEGAWNIWSAHPANRKTSAALMRLIRKDLREHPEKYADTI